jgi:hypothetical protein
VEEARVEELPGHDLRDGKNGKESEAESDKCILQAVAEAAELNFHFSS